jgi:hypothetical protein
MAMAIHLPPQLQAAIDEHSKQRGISSEDLAIDALRERFLPSRLPVEPKDEWEQRLFSASISCGVSVTNSALSSDGLYE